MPNSKNKLSTWDFWQNVDCPDVGEPGDPKVTDDFQYSITAKESTDPIKIDIDKQVPAELSLDSIFEVSEPLRFYYYLKENNVNSAMTISYANRKFTINANSVTTMKPDWSPITIRLAS